MIVLKVIFAIILPPVAAALQVGFTAQFWINLLLTIIGWIPGMIHAFWLILSGRTGHPHATAPPATREHLSHREPVGPRR